MPARYSLARKKAVELLREAGVKAAPVPVEKLAVIVSATIRYEPFSGTLSGMLHKSDKNRAVIGVNSLHAKTRKRFTVAHEIGHLVLHKEASFHIDHKFPIALRSEASSLAVDEKEIEANQFAAELLMPRFLLMKDIDSLPSEIEVEEAIDKLARQYQVSSQAMTIRLSSLGVVS